MMSSINPKELYLRIVTQRGTRTLCHDIVVCCGEEELTDELCERKRLEIVACMQEELEPGEKIVSAEYVSKDSLTPAVRDNDKVVQWRTMDFIAYATSADVQSKLPETQAYGITNKDAIAKVPEKFAVDLPSSPANIKDAIAWDANFWVDHSEELTERFNAWLAK